MIYGNKTPRELSVEIDRHGAVVAVWFRGLLLPFDVLNLGSVENADLRRAEYVKNPPRKILQIEVKDE